MAKSQACAEHTLSSAPITRKERRVVRGPRWMLDCSAHPTIGRGPAARLVCNATQSQTAAPPQPAVLANGVVDYYELLGVDDYATPGEIKMAYRSLAKECHPDYLGDNGHNICVLLNEAYDILSSQDSREVYNQQLQAALIDAMDDFTGRTYSKWLVGHKMGKNHDPLEDRGVFVDEPSCIGCKQCVWLAPGVFRMESNHGRSRVFAQWANDESTIQMAIESCPVDCIHWVHKDQLPSLEYVTRFRSGRNNVANIMAGMGANTDIFGAASQFMKARARKEDLRAKLSKRHSAEQERIRKRAAFDLMKKRGGWFASFYSNLEQAMNGMQSSVDASMDDSFVDDTPMVGRRTRHVPGTAFDDETGATIPVERSLVPLEKK